MGEDKGWWHAADGATVASAVSAAAARVDGERELRYVAGLLFPDGPDGGKPRLTNLRVWEFSVWAMMSYAERLSPGSMFRTSHAE